MAVNEQPEKEKHTVPPELPNALFHMAGRGGWNRISMSTVQSDDKRFTITHIDATRRNDWFLLKDLQTGEQYEETTMTSAKDKAKILRVTDDYVKAESHDPKSLMSDALFPAFKEAQRAGDEQRMRAIVGELHRRYQMNLTEPFGSQVRDALKQAIREMQPAAHTGSYTNPLLNQKNKFRNP